MTKEAKLGLLFGLLLIIGIAIVLRSIHKGDACGVLRSSKYRQDESADTGGNVRRRRRWTRRFAVMTRPAAPVSPLGDQGVGAAQGVPYRSSYAFVLQPARCLPSRRRLRAMGTGGYTVRYDCGRDGCRCLRN